MVTNRSLRIFFYGMLSAMLSVSLGGCSITSINIGKGSPANGKVIFSKTKYRVAFLFLKGFALNHPDLEIQKSAGLLSRNYTILEEQTFGDFLISTFTFSIVQPTTYTVLK